MHARFVSFGVLLNAFCVCYLQACAELLDEENIQVPSWICFSSVDGEHVSSGESLKECLDLLNKSDKVNIIGINCSPPHLIENLICKIKKVT